MSQASSTQTRAGESPAHIPSDADLDLPLRGFEGTPEEIERQWFEKVYRGRGDTQKQLTFRPVITGGILGMLMSVSTLSTLLNQRYSSPLPLTSSALPFSLWTRLPH